VSCSLAIEYKLKSDNPLPFQLRWLFTNLELVRVIVGICIWAKHNENFLTEWLSMLKSSYLTLLLLYFLFMIIIIIIIYLFLCVCVCVCVSREALLQVKGSTKKWIGHTFLRFWDDDLPSRYLVVVEQCVCAKMCAIWTILYFYYSFSSYSFVLFIYLKWLSFLLFSYSVGNIRNELQLHNEY